MNHINAMTQTPLISSDLAVLIGRFQPFHLGHLALLRQALTIAPRVVVVVGSAFQARTPRNPFSWQERQETILQSLSPEEQARVMCLPMRDFYDPERWSRAVRQAVDAMEPGAVTVVGHFKDDTSNYLSGFDGWHLQPLPRQHTIDATAIRSAYFASGPAGVPDGAVPPATQRFLQRFSEMPGFEALREEWRMLEQYKAAWSAAPYPPVFVTVDAVVRCANKVLLIQRGQPPGVGLWALPGGFIEQRETAYRSALRELSEETQLAVSATELQQAWVTSAVFDHPDRSQRGRTITHAFYFNLGDRALPRIDAADDARNASWVDIDLLGEMEGQFHDDHFQILDHFLTLLDTP